MLNTAELAIILGQIVMACCETAGGPGQGKKAPSEHFGRQLQTFFFQPPDQLIECILAQFHWQVPALQPLPGQYLKRGHIVDIHRRAGDKRNPVLNGNLQGTLIVSFHHKLILITDPAQAAQVSFGFNQCLGGKHHVFTTGL